jgi:hypothetical protein
MGFSCSSAAAQEVSIDICLGAGLPLSSLLADNEPPPLEQEELACVVTDDILLFHFDKNAGAHRLQSLDASFEAHNVPRNKSKDIDLASSMVGLGCDLGNSPPMAEPETGKAWEWLTAGIDLCEIGRASPRAFAGALGVSQWFALLSRPYYSIYDAAYEFECRKPQDIPQKVPLPALSEVAVGIALFPLLGAAMDRQYLPLLAASDASTVFGFGVSVASCDVSIARDMGTWAERRGDYVRLTRGVDDEPERPRLGTPRKIPLQKDDFTDVISARAKYKAHAGVLEMQALLLLLKWVLRSVSRHHHRIAVLVDAKTVLGAAAKGRSSSPQLLRILRQIAAHTLAGDLLPRYIYCPSEDNPADGPSRGRQRRPLVRRSSLLNKRLAREKTRYERNRDSVRRSPYRTELMALLGMSDTSSADGSPR